jgi:hypothetical protein
MPPKMAADASPIKQKTPSVRTPGRLQPRRAGTENSIGSSMVFCAAIDARDSFVAVPRQIVAFASWLRKEHFAASGICLTVSQPNRRHDDRHQGHRSSSLCFLIPSSAVLDEFQELPQVTGREANWKRSRNTRCRRDSLSNATPSPSWPIYRMPSGTSIHPNLDVRVGARQTRRARLQGFPRNVDRNVACRPGKMIQQQPGFGAAAAAVVDQQSPAADFLGHCRAKLTHDGQLDTGQVAAKLAQICEELVAGQPSWL